MQPICEVCGVEFSTKTNLNKHLKKFHNIIYVSPKNTAGYNKCALCEYENTPEELRKHYQSIHSLELEEKTFSFSGETSFNDWKKKLEKETFCKYNTLCGEKRGIKRYVCHRSGTFKSKGKGIRHVKAQGSKKINAYCPAQIIVSKSDRDQRILVKFLSTHVGHEQELCHITLLPNFKQQIAIKLADPMPADGITDDMRNLVDSTEPEEEHLLTNEDICNISKEFDISANNRKDHNNAISVTNFVNELRSSGGSSSILYYKPPGELDEKFSALKCEDFMLIIMNNPQIEMLQYFGKDVIVVDSIHVTGYDFQLYTILILDDFRNAFPCSFLISNRGDEEVMKIYFSIVREFCGIISTRTFMSNIAAQFSNAWNSVMGSTKFQLFCTYQVNNAWQKNLVKIRDKNREDEETKRKTVYNLLTTLMEELDKNKFHVMLDEAINTMLGDENIAAFGEYFKSYYANNYEKWALCYRIHAGLNYTYDHLERMHGTLKYIYLKGEDSGRLDKCLFYLMKFIRDKLFSRILVERKDTISNKLRCLQQRHAISNKMTDLVTEKNLSVDGEIIFLVTSSRECIYEVKKNPEKIHPSSFCKLLCNDCNVCIHQFVCTCIDNVIEFNMCKHIHHTIQYLRTAQRTNFEEDTNNVEIDIANIGFKNRANEIVLMELKVENDIKEIDQLFDEAKSYCKNHDTRQFFKAEMKKIILKLKRRNTEKCSPKKRAKKAETSTKKKNSKGGKVTPHIRLFSIKKKTNRKRITKQKNTSTNVKENIPKKFISSDVSMVDEDELMDENELTDQND